MINDNKQYKYHYFYKITNTINNKFYYGVHSTNNLDDGYMGSGSIIKKAIKKYGINYFKKDILKFFNTSEEKYLYEKQFVNRQLLQDPLCYNVVEGGYAFPDGFFKVRDKNGNIHITTKDDPKYLSGELKGINTGKVCVQDKNNNKFLVDVNNPKYLSGELISIAKNKINVFDITQNKYVQINISDFYDNRPNYILFSENKVVVKDDNGHILQISKDDPRYLSGELRSIACDTVSVKDVNGNMYRISKDDPRYLSGELKGVISGYKTYLDETGKIRRGNTNTQTNLKFATYINDKNNKIYTHSDDPRVLSGEYKLFFKDKVPVKDRTGNVIFVSKDDPRYLSGELVRATSNTILMFDINNNKKMIPCDKFKEYYDLQWRPKYFYNYNGKYKKMLERDAPDGSKFSEYNLKTRLYELHQKFNIPLPQ